MTSNAFSAAYLGLHAYPVQIEVDVTNGLPQFILVGLPDQSVKEARERVRAAIKNSGFHFPPEKIIINLAPADIKKEGPAFDLPIALGILASVDVFPAEKLKQYVFLGELALDGSVRPVKGAIVMVSALKNRFSFILPEANAAEAALEPDAVIYPVKTLTEAIELLRGDRVIMPLPSQTNPADNILPEDGPNFSEVKGQTFAKRAVEIAVSGGHNLLLIGAPGSGKSMLAKRIPGILPPLSFDEALEITRIHSSAGLNNGGQLVWKRPFRSPHHNISQPALIGGGTWPKPGEISLAHGGVLFLDEFPEFRRDVIETLRSPLENGNITISRSKMQITYPAQSMLVAAMNPCPCGFLSDPKRVCRCSLGQIKKYQAKISGPILDRIDLHVEVPALTYQTLSSDVPAESSESIRERILKCRAIQAGRYKTASYCLNSRMRPRDIKTYARPSEEGRKLIEMAMKELHLSARAYFKILKVARTIADLAEKESIETQHLAEAIQYRSLDRQWWN